MTRAEGGEPRGERSVPLQQLRISDAVDEGRERARHGRAHEHGGERVAGEPRDRNNLEHREEAQVAGHNAPGGPFHSCGERKGRSHDRMHLMTSPNLLSRSSTHLCDRE